MYERKNRSHFVKLFSGFDPTTIGVNINSIILPEADPVSPVIISIDEIDDVFKDALKPKDMFHTRTHHTNNRKTLNYFPLQYSYFVSSLPFQSFG